MNSTLTKVEQVALTMFCQMRPEEKFGETNNVDLMKIAYERAYRFLDISKEFDRKYNG